MTSPALFKAGISLKYFINLFQSVESQNDQIFKTVIVQLYSKNSSFLSETVFETILMVNL